MSNRQQTIRVDWNNNDNIRITFQNRDGVSRRDVSELVIENIDNKNYISTIITRHTPKILIKL